MPLYTDEKIHFASNAFREIDRLSRPCVVFLRVTNESDVDSNTQPGSGCIISPAGYVLTCSHVVPPEAKKENYKIMAYVGDTGSLPIRAELIESNPQTDLALLRLRPKQDHQWPALVYGDVDSVKESDSLLAFGFPRTANGELVASPGMVRTKFGPGGRWQLSTPVNPGDSGGPVLDTGGNLVAIVFGGIPEAQLINHAIPINFAVNLLNMAGVDTVVRRHAASN
jgi:S1-C subfamily serine protease